MLKDERKALSAKVNAGTASPDEEQKAFLKRAGHPELAALVSTPPPTAEQTKRARARAARAFRRYQRREAKRLTIGQYAAILARRTDRMRVDDVRLARREALDRVTVLPRPMACRGPRSRRVVRRVASRDGPARQSDDPHDPDVAPLCPRCGSFTVVLRSVPTCATCWAENVLALEGRSA